jgi:hypothetical protein
MKIVVMAIVLALLEDNFMPLIKRNLKVQFSTTFSSSWGRTSVITRASVGFQVVDRLWFIDVATSHIPTENNLKVL